jgi:hypothetical protein
MHGERVNRSMSSTKIPLFIVLGAIAVGLFATPSAEAGWSWRRRPVVVVQPKPVVVAPARNRVWVEGHYVRRNGVRVWVPARWVYP